jgi:phosphohistidine phosphatase
VVWFLLTCLETKPTIMKTLILMRHAKSDWSSGASSDFERPLNARGRKAAPQMGKYILENIGSPPLIVCSSATRARETAELFASACKYQGELITREILYSGTPNDYLAVAKSLNDRVNLAVIIGHNPLLEETVSLLLTGNTHGMRVIMPTAAMVCLQTDNEHWQRISEGGFALRWMKIPRMSED